MGEPTIAVFKETEKYAIYGKSGCGKTAQIGMLIEAFGADKVGIVSCEDGIKTVETLVKPENLKACDTLDDLRSAYKWAMERYVGTDKWVCVDGGTRVLNWSSNGENAGADKMFELKVGGMSLAEMPPDIRKHARFLTDKGSLDGFRINARIKLLNEQLIDAWKKLPCNLMWTFWEQETYKDRDKGLPWKPDAPGQGTTDAIINTFDWVIRLKREGGGSATAYLDPTSYEYVAKHRIDMRKGITIPKEIPDFNLAEFHKRIKGQG